MTSTVGTILALVGALQDPMLLYGVVLIGACLALLGVMRRRSMRTTSPHEYTHEAMARIREQQGVARDMETLIVKLSEAARELNAQMDTRFAKLEQVIAESDQKIAALEALLQKADTGRTLDIVVSDSVPAEPAASTSPVAKANKPRKPNKQSRKADEPSKVAVRPVPTATMPPAPAASAAIAEVPARPTESTEPPDLRYGRIYTLADQGQTPIEIARQTGQTTGEVELILNLRKSRALS